MTDARGQTLQDYLFGAILVLLTVLGVFAFAPTVFTPFEEPVESENQQLADRLTVELVEETRALADSQTISFDRLNASLSGELSDRIDAAGIRPTKRVNVTVRDPSTGRTVSASDTDGGASVFRDDPAAASVRTIQGLPGDPCRDGCQLVVRVW